MNVSRRYFLIPLAKTLSLFSVAPLMLVCHQAQAAFEQVVIGETKNIDGSTMVDNWDVSNGGTLNASGARTGYINVTKSDLNLTNTTVKGVNLSGVGISLLFSDSTIVGSSITGGETGMRIAGGTVVITGSQVNGSDFGIDLRTGTSAGSSADLTLVGSQVNGTGPAGVGLHMFGGIVRATEGSVIQGAQNGITVSQGPFGETPTIELDNSRVEGQTGSAIVVNAPFGENNFTRINVNNGSTLVGGNGTLLEVNGANGKMNVSNSALTGNIQVRDSGAMDLDFNQSRLTGDISAEAGSTINVALNNQSVFTGRLENVSSLAVNSAAQWVMVEDSSVANLTMDGGAIKLGEPNAFYKLSVENLSGNGTFIMDADFSQGKVDFLDVTGTATGNHSLLVGATGADPVADSSLHVVHTAAGDAQFSLLNGPVDMGTYSYALSQQNGNDWYLINTGKVSAGTSAVLALFNTAPTVWYGELSSLRSRMGELRINGAQPGGWVRTYGNRFDAKAASGVGYQQTQQGLSFGADAPLPIGDGQWLVGLLGGYSKSDLSLDRGTSGQVNSYYLGAYTTWLDHDSGYYFDGVLKFNRFRNEADVSLSDGTKSKGDYDNSGVGASLEFGKHIKLDNNYFLEPYTQLSGVVIQGKDYGLDNGMQAEGDRTRSLLGKLGTTAGRNFDLGEGKVVQPYVRAAYVHEFARNNDVEVNNNVFNNDLSGSRGELGVGIAMSMSDRLQLHADFEYSNGDKIKQPWGANVGVRYSW
ncbi:autotransporter outer membrane beta-barrel domain-containing protein [Pseudomonas syringae]|uniref:autotransporter outer membrane beta-barrel domain-containing protein n=1 Tax=Pseudomonas syringae TaxID=317 RepID=UPI00046D7C37|nr:autotransporter outer membrane beta-barrel domain-containing protein [Pseudomonas syringae]